MTKHKEGRGDPSGAPPKPKGRGGKNDEIILPVLPLRDAVLFPFTVMPLLVGRRRSLRLLEDVEEERDVIRRALSPDPEDRFETARAMVDALEQAVHRRPLEIRRDKKVAGHTLRQKLGTGQSSVIWLAKDGGAVEITRLSSNVNESTLRRISRLAQLNHPHLHPILSIRYVLFTPTISTFTTIEPSGFSSVLVISPLMK